jgi:hypothetical protein
MKSILPRRVVSVDGVDWRRGLRIVVLGAGVQGTVFAVRLAIDAWQFAAETA